MAREICEGKGKGKRHGLGGRGFVTRTAFSWKKGERKNNVRMWSEIETFKREKEEREEGIGRNNVMKRKEKIKIKK